MVHAAAQETRDTGEALATTVFPALGQAKVHMVLQAIAADIMLCPTQVDVDGKPWPLDAAGKPVLKT